MSFRKRNVVLSSPATGPGDNASSTAPTQPTTTPSPSPSPAPAPAPTLPARGNLPNRGPPTATTRNVPSPAPGRLPLRPSPVPARGTPGNTSTNARTTKASAPRVVLPPVTWPTESYPRMTDDEMARLAPEMQALDTQMAAERRERRERRTRRQPRPVAPLDAGARPSPLDGRPITSTGTASLDALLAGYGGLALGHALLVQELGTTDFGSVLLRAFAAEGLVQGHHVHVLGVGPGWRTELPGLLTESSRTARAKKAAADAADAERMKIAWRYETLARTPASREASRESRDSPSPPAPFCHAFDLTKRLQPAGIKGALHATPLPSPLRPSLQPEHEHSPLRRFLASVQHSLATTPPSSIHRVVLPGFLAPTVYAMDGWSFEYVLTLLAGLRALLRAHARRLTVVVGMSTSLYAHDNACVFALERLMDTVVELIPLPPGPPSAAASANKPGPAVQTKAKAKSKADASPADKMQGWCKVHRLQVYSDGSGRGRGAQGRALAENLCFSVSRDKGLVIAPYSLPPIEDLSAADAKKNTKDDMEF